MFTKELLTPETLKQINSKRKHRVYETPGGTYPSVTAVLSEYFSNDALERWRAKIGHNEAENITNKARVQGHTVHKLVEDYLMDNPSTTPVMPSYRLLFTKIKPFLDKNLSKIYGVEFQTYSTELCTAGTIDLIAEYNNRWKAITDFKTSNKIIDENSEKLLKYKLQAVAYSMMIKERYEIDIPYSVIIAVIPDEPNAQIFTIRNNDHIKKVKEIFEWAKEYME